MSYFASGNSRNTAVANTCAAECRRRCKSSDAIEGEDWCAEVNDIRIYREETRGKGKGKEGSYKGDIEMMLLGGEDMMTKE